MKNLREVFRSRVQKIHFIGVGGSGMSGIAEVFHNLGYEVSGSDIVDNKITQKLAKMGCKISNSHHQDNIKNAQAVVVSSAIADDNIELLALKNSKIPIVPRAEMLAELMRFRFGIAVAGTHGKTTTTSLIAHILSVAKLDPTFIIGGILNATGSNAKLGGSNYLIVEADESDASFLHLQPMLSVITNIDHEHMGTYQNNYKNLKNAFLDFTSNLPFYGACVVCIDDSGVADIAANISRPLITYGFNKDADIFAKNISQTERQMHFEAVCSRYNKEFSVTLNLIGKHNILNTLAAIGVCCELGIGAKIIKSALRDFSGVARRLDYNGKILIGQNHALLFDDYGHHPNEIRAVFASLKNTYPKLRLVVIFQPHRYSRTHDLFADFVKILSKADALILLKVYAAGEEPIPNATSNDLADAIKMTSNLMPIVAKNRDEVLKILPKVVKNTDLVLTLGAGDIHNLAAILKQNYAAS